MGTFRVLSEQPVERRNGAGGFVGRRGYRNRNASPLLVSLGLGKMEQETVRGKFYRASGQMGEMGVGAPLFPGELARAQEGGESYTEGGADVEVIV